MTRLNDLRLIPTGEPTVTGYMTVKALYVPMDGQPVEVLAVLPKDLSLEESFRRAEQMVLDRLDGRNQPTVVT